MLRHGGDAHLKGTAMDAHEFTMFKIAFVVTMAATIASHPSQMSHLRLPAPVWTNATSWTGCPEGSPTGCADPGDMVFVGP